ITDSQDVRGLAVSGGGIRSASFGLGVMQALVGNNQLEKIHYLSTVSGGGYLGSALTWALHQYKNSDTTKANFPLGKLAAEGAKVTDKSTNPPTEDEEQKDDTEPKKEEELKEKEEPKEGNMPKEDEDELKGNELLDFIRLHGAYLTPIAKLDIISFAAVVLRSMVMSLFVYVNFFTIAITASLFAIYQTVHLIKGENYETSKDWFFGFGEKGVLFLVGLLILAAMVLLGFIFSIRTFFSKKKWNNWYQSFINSQKRLGWWLKFSLTCLVFGSLPFVAKLLQETFSNVWATASASTVFGAIVGMWQYIKASKKEKNKGGSSDLLIYAGAFALFYGVLLFAYIIATEVFLHNAAGNDTTSGLMYNAYDFRHGVVFLIVIALTLIFGFFVNLNALGPHLIWRSRLMEAFMPDKIAVRTNKWFPAKMADVALMKDMCWENGTVPGPDIAGKCKLPYHIVNTNIILPKSSEVKYAGRGGDNFIISPLYCGSDATKWRKTEDFQKTKASSSGGITLASAMATSAAALNPNAGVSGEGVTRNAVISVLLSMLNLRLGYWTSNPKNANTLVSPNFFFPGLWTEIFRNGFSENNKDILLSDGGHFENTAIYELIRRKCNLIIVADGGEDHKFNFDDLANAIEKARVDFGTKIRFMDENKVDDILPGSSGDGLFQKKYEISKRGYAFADILYPDDKDGTKHKGTLVYIKLAVIEGLATDVYSFKGVNPLFPHESTADQFFNEKQFEAYRELGYYIGWQMMLSKQGKILFPEKKVGQFTITNKNSFKNISGNVHSREVHLRINGEEYVNLPPIIINFPVDLNEVGSTIAEEISLRYRYFILNGKTGDAVPDWIAAGTAEANIDNITYQFTYEMKKFTELPDETHFYVKLIGNKTEMIWHSSADLGVG
ncbi:MAG: hypothetical protein ABI685_15010, partial [Ferruginibacter sp.]